MIRKNLTIAEYKNNYFNSKNCIPGEHHFVAVYLLPKFQFIPDFLNPDGTKDICGDIVFKNKDDIFSIEVKIGNPSICFSKKEKNSWFVEKEKLHPNYLIILTRNYLFIIKWQQFFDSFSSLLDKRIESKTGNSKRISEQLLLDKCSGSAYKIENGVETKLNKAFSYINGEISNMYKVV